MDFAVASGEAGAEAVLRARESNDFSRGEGAELVRTVAEAEFRIQRP